MPELPTFISPGPTAPPMQPQVNPLAMSQSGEALAQAGQRAAGTFEDWNQRYADARRVTDADNAIAGASKQLGDLQFKYSKVPDRAAAMAGFQKEAGYSVDPQTNAFSVTPGGVLASTLDQISDPLVKAHVTDQLLKEATARGLDTQNAAFQLESNARRGQLDANLFQYSQQASTAGTPQLRAIITDNANAAIAGSVQAGWLHPEEGTQRAILFRANLAKADAMTYIRTASAAADAGRLSPLDIADHISDPQNFVGLTPDERAQIADTAIRLGRTIVSMKAADQAHTDAVAERQLKATQQGNEIDLFDQIGKGQPPTPDQLRQLGDTQQISAAGYVAAQNEMTKKENGTDDPATAAKIFAGLAKGDDVSADVLAGRDAGGLSRTTAIELLKANAAKGAQGDKAIDQANFATLKTALGIGADGGIVTFPGEKQDETNARLALSTQAQSEWTKRVRIGGEDSTAVLADMLPRYARMPDRPEAWPTPRMGAVTSIDDVGRVWAATKAAHDAKTMSDAAFSDEAALLNRYRAYYQQKAAADAAAKSAPAPGAKPSRSEAAPPASDTEFGGVR